MHTVFPSPKLVPQKVTGFIAWLQQQPQGEWWRALSRYGIDGG